MRIELEGADATWLEAEALRLGMTPREVVHRLIRTAEPAGRCMHTAQGRQAAAAALRALRQVDESHEWN